MLIAVILTVCQLQNGWYQFAYTGQVDGWQMDSGAEYRLDALQARGDGVRFTVFYDSTSQSVYGYPDAPLCPDRTDEWKPNCPSILIPASSANWFHIEVMDAYRHWSLVTDDAHPDGIVLFPQNGFVELIGSVGQDTDPDHYRLIEVMP